MALLLPGNFTNYSFFVPLIKAVEEHSDSAEGSSDPIRSISGVASTENPDIEDEIVVQKGIDYSYFLNHGFFNDDHKKGIAFKVGEPTSASINSDGFSVGGFLYKGKPAAEDIWNHLMVIKANPNSNRKVGFSVQGKVLRKAGNRILKSWVQDVAVTASPINPYTYVDIIKSLSNNFASKDEILEYEEQVKALQVGYDLGAPTNGAALCPEDLDNDIHNLTYGIRGKRVSEKEVSDRIRKSFNIHPDLAVKLSKIVFDLFA